MVTRLLLLWREEKKMYSRWIEMELNRLHCVTAWPDSAYKRATLAGIAQGLKSFGYERQPLFVVRSGSPTGRKLAA